MSLAELSEKAHITRANLSILKQGASSVRDRPRMGGEPLEMGL